MDKTLVKGLVILETLARSDDPRGVSDIARELDLTKSNTHRLLQTLVAKDYVFSTGGKYRLSSKMWVLGADAISKLDFKRVALPELEKLAETTSETVHLSIYEKSEVIYVEKIDSPQPIRAYTKVGGRAPAHCVATGKVLLAFQSSEVIEEVLAHLEPITEYTITDQARMRDELDAIRGQGYAVNRGEWRSEIGGIAAPIFDSQSRPVAALGISGPKTRLSDERVPELAALVKQAAGRISTMLGATL
ncbi:IclR family transcriptional regulator [Salinisphaera sp. T31B1]|uniref:IclR family transcriptional regulator n=1 Tax=Salinisphaera sp. T31B1 TaxID=727963 RepID=UPI00334016E7